MTVVADKPNKRTAIVVAAGFLALIATELAAGLGVSGTLSNGPLLVLSVTTVVTVVVGVTVGVALSEGTSVGSVVRRVLATEDIRGANAPAFLRRWHLLVAELLLLAGCYAPPYWHSWDRRVIGVLSGASLAMLGLAEGRDWKGPGSLLWPAAKTGGREAAGTVFIGAVCVVAWASGLIG